MVTTRRRPARYADLNPRLVVQTWCVSRALLVLALLVVVIHQHRRLSDALSGWDVEHFMAIARNGYAARPDMAFFPALPAVLRAGATLGLPMVLTGTLLAIACSALAAWAVLRIGGVAAACFWMVAPMTVFTVVPYTEAPFAAAAFWAWDRALSRRWGQAVLLAAIACAFRVSGAFLVFGLAVMVMMQYRGRQRTAHLSLLVVPLAVIGSYMVFLHHLTGDWYAWFHAQSTGWSRGGITSPLSSFRLTWQAAHFSYWPGRHLVAVMFAFEIVTVLAGTATTVWLLARREWAEAAWVGVQVLVFATSHWWMSASRAVLLWFPLFVLLGERASRRPATESRQLLLAGVTALGVVVSALTSVFWAWCFFSGNWAT